MGRWLAYVKTGDWLVLGAGVCAVVWLGGTLWGGATADKLVVRRSGVIFAQLALDVDRRVVVPGVLGDSVVVIHNRRVRVARDPGPRQLCVKQGWLSKAGDAALCLPNQVSLELIGTKRSYDSLNY
ncbi:MAG: NusG domain II-containing protein [Burkholderiales bacterium]